MFSNKPAYTKTFKRGLLKEKKEKAFELMKNCTLCPRNCRVNRMGGEKGICKTGVKAIVSDAAPHFGEEIPLIGINGSGTIFFTYCSLQCNFCQNYDISFEGYGREVSDEQLADMMLRLQKKGCHNINFVTPSHVIPQILAALEIAVKAGLSVPLVYNSGGYDSVEALTLMEGVIDIYMPDFKFWDNANAKLACNVTDYREVAMAAIIEMHRQVGDLIINKKGLATKGLLLRHLILPEGISGTRDVMQFISQNISPNTYINIMPQYRPCGKARLMKGFSREIMDEEFKEAVVAAKKAGLTRLDRNAFQ